VLVEVLRVIVVFWLEGSGAQEAPRARHAAFASGELGPALQLAEELRGRRRAGAPISHVAIQSELPESVGAPGVADPAADYAHYKRRPDPSIPLGRPSGKPEE
jgi:hypothetical protein